MRARGAYPSQGFAGGHRKPGDRVPGGRLTFKIMNEEQGYGRRALIEAYLSARGDDTFGGYEAESPAYNAALRAHHERMLDGLERLFGIRLTAEGVGDFRKRVLFILFRTTADSLLALRTPWSGFLEAGLLLQRLEAAGEPGARVLASSDRIWSRTTESREDHLLILDELLGVLLGDRAELTFGVADLRDAGVDPVPPASDDHPDD